MILSEIQSGLIKDKCHAQFNKTFTGTDIVNIRKNILL